MGVRGAQYQAAIRTIVDTFGTASNDLVFLGSCVLGLYMRIADLCARGVLEPDPKLACRYHIAGKDIAVDVLSPEGMNIGNITEWFLRAVARAGTFPLEGNVSVRAVTPPHFMALKLEAWRDRGSDAQSDKDAEDIVAVATEVPDLATLVQQEGIGEGLRDLWQAALARHDLAIEDLRELVSWHLHPIDAAEEDRVVASLLRCAQGA